MKVAVRPLREVDLLADLAADAERDGKHMIAQLLREWREGVNRFKGPGEKLYVALSGDRIVGVCGLNRDPFAKDENVGRVRRLYVAADSRRRGVASALVRRLLSDAIGRFATLHVRTHDPLACEFYRSIGFTDVDGDEFCTHACCVVA